MILVKKLNGEQDTGMKKKRTKRAISLLGKRRRKVSLPPPLFLHPPDFFVQVLWENLAVLACHGREGAFMGNYLAGGKRGGNNKKAREFMSCTTAGRGRLPQRNK